MKQEGIHQDIQDNHWAGDREANSQIFCWIMKNYELDTVEGLAPSEMEKGPTRSFSVRGAGNVGAPATLDSFAPTICKEKRDDGCAPGLIGT
jgi:hypothetical protein